MSRVLTCRRYTPYGPKTYAWDASTPSKRDEAYLRYFNLMVDLKVAPYNGRGMNITEMQLWDKARAGNVSYARAFVALVENDSDLCEVDVIGSEDKERKIVKVLCEEALKNSD